MSKKIKYIAFLNKFFFICSLPMKYYTMNVIVLNKKRGEKVNKGDVLAYIHSNSEEKIEKARKSILENIVIEDSYDLNIPLIYDIVR